MAKTKKPRISVNKLAEYLEANSTRRKQIVYDAKYPEKFIVTRYKDAKDVIFPYLTHHRDEDIVLNEIDGIKAKKAKTDFQEQDQRLSVESLEALLETDLSSLDGCELSQCDDENKLVSISDVDISVNPDIIIKRVIHDVTHIGAMKLHISKNNTLSEESQNIVAVMIINYVSSFLSKKGQVVQPKLCISYDVFNESLQCCPTSYKLRMRRIEAACEEIALWWDKL
jgi:hypothetical protein